MVNGKTKFRSKDFVEGTFYFDTEKYWDEENNYYNVVSDFLQEEGVLESNMLIVRKLNKKPPNE